MVFILCGAVGSAQNITADIYNKLLGYCSCKYAEEYLDKYYAQTENKNAQSYKTNIKPDLSKCSIDDHLPFDDLVKKIKSPATDLVKNYYRTHEKKNAVDSLFLDNYGKDFKVDFSELNRKLRVEIQNYLNREESVQPNLENESSSNKKVENNLNAKIRKRNNDPDESNKDSEGIKDEKPDTKTSVSNGKTFLLVITSICLFICAIIRWRFWNKIKGNKKKTEIFYGIVAFLFLMLLFALFKIVRIIIIAIVTILILGIVILYYFKKQKKNNNPTRKPEEKTEKINYKQEYKNLKEELQALNTDYKRLSEFNKEILAERNEWERKFKDLKRQTPIKHGNIDFGEQITDYQNKTKPIVNETISVLYADAIIDGFFNRIRETPNEDTIFELHLQNAQIATFSIYHSAKQLIINRPEFLDGCDKQVLNNAQGVKIESEGTAQRQADGKWKIIKKLNVIIN